MIAACGVPGIVRAHWLKPGATVVDVGINYVQVDGKQVLTGDVEFNELALQRCKAITPVPGGVGPMTVTMLMSNLVESWELHNSSQFAVGGKGESLRSLPREPDTVCQQTAHEHSHNLRMQ